MAEIKLSGAYRFWALFILVLPFLVLGYLTFQAYQNQTAHPLFKVKIIGYDPRDILRGHYLVYRYDWNWTKGQPDDSQCQKDGSGKNSCCLCLGGPEVDPKVRFLSCEANTELKQCQGVIQGWPGLVVRADTPIDRKYSFVPQRFYIPERYAKDLEQLLREGKKTFRMGISVRPDKKAFLEDLYIDDVSLSEYLKTHTSELK